MAKREARNLSKFLEKQKGARGGERQTFISKKEGAQHARGDDRWIYSAQNAGKALRKRNSKQNQTITHTAKGVVSSCVRCAGVSVQLVMRSFATNVPRSRKRNARYAND